LNSDKSKAGQISARDFNEILAQNTSIKPNDFITHYEEVKDDADERESHLFTNFLAFVENTKVKDFENNYERWGEQVVPRSAKKLNTTKDDLANWSIFVFQAFARTKEDVISKARHQKIVVKEFAAYDLQLIESRRSGNDIEVTYNSSEQALKQTCDTIFQELFSSFIHIKVLKIVIDSMMRFGSPENFFLYNLEV